MGQPIAQGSGLMAKCPGQAWNPSGRPVFSEYTTDLKSLKTLVLFALSLSLFFIFVKKCGFRVLKNKKKSL